MWGSVSNLSEAQDRESTTIPGLLLSPSEGMLWDWKGTRGTCFSPSITVKN